MKRPAIVSVDDSEDDTIAGGEDLKRSTPVVIDGETVQITQHDIRSFNRDLSGAHESIRQKMGEFACVSHFSYVVVTR